MRDDCLDMCRQRQFIAKHLDVKYKEGRENKKQPESHRGKTSRKIGLSDSRKKLCALQQGDNRE